MKKLLLFSILFFNINSLFCQSFSDGLSSIATKGSTVENLMFLDEVNLDPKTFFKNYKNLFGLSNFDSMNIYKVNNFEDGHTVYKFEQYYKGLKVWGSDYLLHQNAKGKLFLGNGHVGNHINIQINPLITKSKSIELAIKNSNCKSYPWQFDDSSKNSKYPTSELIIFNPSFGSNELLNTYYLCYKVDVYCDHSESIMIDAKNGEIIGRVPLQFECIPTTVNTIYNGIQTINTQIAGNTYNLIDDCQAAIFRVFGTYRSNMQFQSSILTDASNTWLNYKIKKQGASALWSLKKTYDYYKNKRNYLSIDNKDNNISCYIMDYDYEQDYAYLIPSRYTITIGPSLLINNTFSTLDIIAHEFTHGVIYYTSGLEYINESGALHESFSDIFGEIIEKDVTNTNDWIIGGQRASGGLRSLSNPTQFNHPKYYQDTLWYYGIYDYGGVHTNSGVQNYWFYLLTHGGGSVTGLGFEKSSLIAFKTLQQFLTKSSNYIDARNQSINAAIYLYGINSNEVCQVTNAWNQVGLGEACNLNACDSCHCALQIESSSACTYHYFNLYDNSFDSTVDIPFCKNINSTKTKDMWYKFIAANSTHTIKVALINYDSSNMINPSISLYQGCHKYNLVDCIYSYKKSDSTLELKATGLEIGKTYFVRFMDYHKMGDTVPKNSLVGLCITHEECPHPKFLTVIKDRTLGSYTLKWVYNPNYKDSIKFRIKTLHGTWQTRKIYISDFQTLFKGKYRDIQCDSTYVWQLQANCYDSNQWSKSETFVVDSCFLTKNTDDLSVTRNQIYLENGILRFYQIIQLTGTFDTLYGVNAIYYLSKNSDGSTRDYFLYTDEKTLDIYLFYRKYFVVNPTFNLCDMLIPNGKYYVCYSIDDKNNLEESNEENNKGVFDGYLSLYCFPTPDITSDIPTVSFQNNVLRYQNKLRNIGIANSTSFNANLYLVDTSTFAIIHKIHSQSLDVLIANTTYDIDWTIDLCKFNINNGPYKVMLLIDSARVSGDTNYQNNFNIYLENYKVECDYSASIHAQNTSEVVLYPNPTNGVIYIRNLTKKVLVNVFDLHGKLVKSEFTKDAISLEDLSSGIYIIKVEEKVFKITKNK